MNQTAGVPGEPVLVLRDVHKSFGAQPVLDGISLNVVGGETLTVLGRSGTGKSVLLRLIIGLDDPDAGSIGIHGQEIVGLDLAGMNRLRIKMGFLFQHAALYDSLTVEQNVAFPLERRQFRFLLALPLGSSGFAALRSAAGGCGLPPRLLGAARCRHPHSRCAVRRVGRRASAGTRTICIGTCSVNKRSGDATVPFTEGSSSKSNCRIDSGLLTPH